MEPMREMNQAHYDKILYCPRCHGDELIIYSDSFQCINCDMEFEKDDIGKFEDDEILSIGEKLALRSSFWLAWF